MLGGEVMRISSQTRFGVLVLALGLIASVTPGAGLASPLTEPRERVKAFPYCSWWVVTTPETMNVAYPDTSAIYWTTPFVAKPGESIVVNGTFPEARFMSLTVYDNSFDDFTTNGVNSQIDDYQILPDEGSTNPWDPSAPAGADSGGSFTVTITPKASASVPNTLPILPQDPVSSSLFPARTGFLIYRVYLPEGGMQAVSLPSLTLLGPTGKKTSLSRCSGKDQAALAKTARGLKLLALMKKLKDGGTGAAPELCSTNGGSCPPNYQFFRPTPAVTGKLFPNASNAYAAMTFPPTTGQAVVIRLLAPTSPAGVGGGTSPIPWPTDDYQVRYWSVCNNIYAVPFPVVANRSPQGTTYGCVSDSEAVLDSDGYATFVITKPGERPSKATTTNGYNWIPTSLKKGSTTEMVAVRNMLPSADFPESVLAAPPNGVPGDTAEAMGEYYPTVATCSLADFEAGGGDACFTADGTR